MYIAKTNALHSGKDGIRLRIQHIGVLQPRINMRRYSIPCEERMLEAGRRSLDRHEVYHMRGVSRVKKLMSDFMLAVRFNCKVPGERGYDRSFPGCSCCAGY